MNHRRTYDVKFLVGVGVASQPEVCGCIGLQHGHGGPCGAPRKWIRVWLGELTLFLLPPHPQGPSGDPRSWAQEVAEPGLTPEDTLSIFGFLPLSQKHNESTTTRNILPSVWQPAPGPEALPPEEDLPVLPAETT